MANKSKTLVVSLIAIILVLAAVLIYAFAIKPAYTGYVTEQQELGAQYGYQYAYEEVMGNLFGQLQQNGYVQLPYGNETVILVPYNPQAQPAAPLQ